MVSVSGSAAAVEEPAHAIPADTKAKFKAKGHSKHLDPCQEAANRSIRCLNRNNGDREMCSDYFQAYRDCKKIWMDQMKKDNAKGESWT